MAIRTPRPLCCRHFGAFSVEVDLFPGAYAARLYAAAPSGLKSGDASPVYRVPCREKSLPPLPGLWPDSMSYFQVVPVVAGRWCIAWELVSGQAQRTVIPQPRAYPCVSPTCGVYVRCGRLLRMAASVKIIPERRPTREGKGRRELWLDTKTLHRAQSILGTATERETVEVALDMIAFRRELLEGTQKLSRLKIDPIR